MKTIDLSIAKNQPQKKVFTFAYYWHDLEKITNDFLRFADEFNQIPTACFELEPSSASH
ncbi:hypothetical protein MMM109_16030 [Helicobacter pylori]